MAKKWINIVIGVIGSIVLLFFIYGGVLFVISAGNQETVTKAKRVITGSIIGLLIVFLSYTIIYFTAKTLGVDVTGSDIFKSDWFNN